MVLPIPSTLTDLLPPPPPPPNPVLLTEHHTNHLSRGSPDTSLAGLPHPGRAGDPEDSMSSAIRAVASPNGRGTLLTLSATGEDRHGDGSADKQSTTTSGRSVLDVPEWRCVRCKTLKQRHAFSTTQLKSKQKAKCKTCVTQDHKTATAAAQWKCKHCKQLGSKDNLITTTARHSGPVDTRRRGPRARRAWLTCSLSARELQHRTASWRTTTTRRGQRTRMRMQRALVLCSSPLSEL